MEICSILSALCVLILSSFSELAWAQYSIDSVTLSTQRASEGDSLTAICDVKNEAQERIVAYWIRKIPNHEQEVEITTNGVVNDVFKHTHRYNASYTTASPSDLRSIRFVLNIINLKTEDTGSIGCRLTGPGQERERFQTFVDFIVSAPIQQISWTSSEVNSTKLTPVNSDGSSLELREDQVRRFVCSVNGSYPKPEVRVLIGDLDITSQFQHHAVLVRGAGLPGLQPLYYKVDVSHDALKIDYSFNEKQLRCVASLSPADLPASVTASAMQKTASINITLLYKPKFRCGMEAFTKLNEPNYNLICTVHSNPEVKLARVHWNDPTDASNDTIDTLEDGMKSGDYEANVTEVSELETVIVLTISRVYQQHFKTYIFEAENDLGRVTHSIELKQDFGSANTRSVSAYVTCIPSLIASLIVVNNLITKWCLYYM
jgi:hypothetical protein